MFISRAMIIRLLSVAVIFVSAWTLWKRIDAVIDNYQRMYDVALIQEISKQQQKEFNEKFEAKWNDFHKDFKKPLDNKVNSPDPDNQAIAKNKPDTDKKWDDYTKNAVVKQYNKPVPERANEYTMGYYHGLFEFFIRSGFASIFVGGALFGLSLLAIKTIWHKISDEKINAILQKRGIS